MSARFPLALALIVSACAPPIQPEPAPLPPNGEVSAQQWAAGCTEWDEWDKPAPPWRIYGNTYYVGTCGISAILITGSDGLILIDSGTEPGAAVVMDNIRKLGFRLNEIAMILHSHEHFDHVGGHAAVQQASGAHVFASPEAADVLRTGKDNPADPQAGMHTPMKPVPVEVIILEGEFVRTENTVVTAIATPGHTPGALSWTWQACEDGTGCNQIVYADSLSPIGSETYRFSDHPEYLAAFRAGLDRLTGKPCDILLTPHPSASGMVARAATGSLVGGVDCAGYAASIRTRLEAKLAEERAGG